MKALDAECSEEFGHICIIFTIIILAKFESILLKRLWSFFSHHFHQFYHLTGGELHAKEAYRMACQLDHLIIEFSRNLVFDIALYIKFLVRLTVNSKLTMSKLTFSIMILVFSLLDSNNYDANSWSFGLSDISVMKSFLRCYTFIGYLRDSLMLTLSCFGGNSDFRWSVKNGLDFTTVLK